MADGRVEIEVKTNTAPLEEGLKKAEKQVTDTAGKITRTAADANKSIEKSSKKIGNLNKTLKETSNAASSFASKMSSVVQTGGPYVAAAVAAIGATKKLGETMRECSDAYKIQERAEKALEIAAKNNPYIDGQAVAALKEFASELQGASDIGDEVSIRLMTPLVAAGRTKEQIKQIMQAAADYAAGTGTDMANAVETLNATYSGITGAIGKQLDGVKNLTEEQLKNGEAVKLVAERYKGMAKELADTRKQAEGAKGDFKEMLGAFVAPAVEVWDRFWKGFYETGTKALSWLKNNLDLASIDSQAFLQEMLTRNQIVKEKKTVREAVRTDPFNKIAMAKAIKQEEYTAENKINLSDSSTKELERLIALLKIKKSLSLEEQQLQKDALALLQQRQQAEQEAARLAKEKAEQEAATKKLLEEQEKERKKLDDFLKEDKKRVQERITSLELEAKMNGKAVDAQAVYNVYLQSYLDLLTKTDGKIKESYPIVQKRIGQMKEAKQAVDEQTESEKKLKKAIEATNALIKSVKDIQASALSANPLQRSIEQYKKIKTEIEKMSDEEVKKAQEGNEIIYSKQELLENLAKGEIALEGQKIKELTALHTDYFDTYKKQQEDLLALKKSIDESEVLSEQAKADAKLKIDEEYAHNKAALANQVLEQIKEYTQQAVQIAQEAGNMMLEYTRNEQKIALAQLNERYEKGEIAETEYTEKSLAIKKKAAQKEYKIRMFQWTASLLAAMANIAEGVSKAISLGFPMGLITGPLVAAAGGVQIASIMASKPTPPSFAKGGIVPGASYSGDHVPAFVNSGEMIANFPQQKRLWAMLNGQEQYKPSFPVTVNNTQSNRVSAQAREQNGELYIDILEAVSTNSIYYHSKINKAAEHHIKFIKTSEYFSKSLKT